MDVTLTCPQCSAQFVASDAAENVVCRQCNATIPVTAAKTPKRKLGMAQRREEAPRAEATAEAGSVAATLGQLAESGEAPEATRGIAEEDLPDSLREGLEHRRAMAKAMKRRKASLRREQIQSALLAAAACTLLVGLCITGMAIGSEGAVRASVITLLVMGTACGIGILFTSFMDGFKSFCLAGLLPMLSNFLPMMWPIAGLVIGAFALLYQIYFVFWVSGSGLLKGAYIPCMVGVNWIVVHVVLKAL